MILVAGAILFIIIVGLMIASVTGYMAGLIGASNSPVSGIGILAIIASSLLLLGLLGRGGGEEEINANEFTLKNLVSGAQQKVDFETLVTLLQ